MHLHFERVEKPSSYCDCIIRTLSWMGKVPDGPLQKEEEGWKLNRSQYYSDGWLASGNVRGIVGCTFTTCGCRKIPASDLPGRTNYNLRGHRAEVTIVKWNEPYQKLATCDSSGIIFVWIKYEGRWSIELINDRNTPVTDFAWSHDGRMALICYTDGFVLVGSVTGQRYWSSMLNLESCHTTCGIWTPDDQQVLFGTSKGHIIVIQVNGTVVSQVPVREGASITSMAWSCEKFKMEDTDEPSTDGKKNQEFALAVCFTDGVIYLMKNYDDIFPTVVVSRLESVRMEWSNNGDVLAVAGHNRKTLTTDASHLNRIDSLNGANGVNPQTRSQSAPSTTPSGHSSSSALNHEFSPSIADSTPHHRLSQSSSSHAQKVNQASSSTATLFVNSINFYTVSGVLRFRVNINFLLYPITALTWGHNDKRIFIATGAVLHIAWISKKVPSLQLLSRLSVFKLLPNEASADQLKLPSRVQALISSLFGRTLRCYLPDMSNLRDYVSKPPIGSARLHCTLIRHDDDLVGGSTTYVLYLEYLGGLVPILKGKRASKLKPEFVIYDPQVEGDNKISPSGKYDAAPVLTAAHSAPQSRSTTPILSRRKTPSHTGGHSLYWNSRSTTPASGSESESEDGSCMTDGYGHVYSLPSPVMRRKCRRKRGGPSQADVEERRIQETALNLIPDQAVPAAPAAAADNQAVGRNNNRNNSSNNNANAVAEGNARAPETASAEPMKPESTYMDEMPEAERLILVTSNIWGTKFKILGLSPRLPASLGTISYRTSVLHLQPRQMTLQIKELGSRRGSSGGPDLVPNTPSDVVGSFANEDEAADGIAVVGGSYGEYVDAYIPIAPMTPRKSIRGQRRTISPDHKQRMFHLRCQGSQSSHHEYRHAAMIPALNEEMLTLQINADSSRVTMELHQIPSANSGHFPAARNHSQHHRSHPILASATSQTSFYELGSDYHQIHYVNRPHRGRGDEDLHSIYSPSDDRRPDDLITQMARKLAAEYTSQLSTSPILKHPTPPLSSPFLREVLASAPNGNHHCLPTASSHSNFPITASSSFDGFNFSSPQHNSYHQKLRENNLQLFKHHMFNNRDQEIQHLYAKHEEVGSAAPFPAFPAPVSPQHEINFRSVRYRMSSIDAGEKESPRRCSGSMLSANNNGSAVTAAVHLNSSPRDNCDNETSILRSSVLTSSGCGTIHSDKMRGHLRKRLDRQQQLLQQINQKQAAAVLVASPSHNPSDITSYIPASQLTQISSSASTAAAGSSSGSSRSIDESPSCHRHADIRSSSMQYSCPQDIMKFIDDHDADEMKAGRSAEACSPHRHPHASSSSALLTDHPSLLLSTASSHASESDSPFPKAASSSISARSGMGHHSDFLNVRLRSGSTPSTRDVPRLTLRTFCQKSVSEVPLDQEFGFLQQKAQIDSATSKFNCTELDGIDAACLVGECLSCECEKECLTKIVSPSRAFRQKTETAGHYDSISVEKSAYRSESGFNQITSSNILSTPVHRPNRNRSLDYDYMAYENLLSRESLISVPAVSTSSRILTDSQLSSGLFESAPDSDLRRCGHMPKHQLQLQLSRPSTDLRPSPGITSDAERLPNLSGINFNLIRSNSINSSASIETRVRSLPASPAQKRKAFGRSLLNSPLMLRKVLKQKLNYLDCSSEDESSDAEDSVSISRDFLESFQRSKIKQKMQHKTKAKPRRGSRVQPEEEGPKLQEEFREYILQNKAPFWNELSQVYQLDFGGRVTQESAKNFQIEHQANQVMQFGRIDGNAYTLDFQYPFSALQALAVALANVTQRLK